METNTNIQNQESIRTAYWAWGAAALFFFYQYIFRVAIGVMIDDLRHDFSLTAEEFSSLGAYYLYGYSLIQIPLGIFVDRVGVRKTVIGTIMLYIVGVVMMGVTQSYPIALLSRVFCGIGSASAFMCALKVVADRLPPGKRGFLMGATLGFGAAGALIAGKPLVWSLDSFGWRPTTIAFAALGLFILIAALTFLPKRAKNRPHLTDAKTSKISIDIWHILTHRRIMLYALLAVGLYTPLSALADLWGTSFMMQKYGLDRQHAAQTTTIIYLGMAIGSILLPWLSEKLGILNRAIQVCGLGMLAIFALILYGPLFSTTILPFIVFTLGIFCGAEMMCFTGAVLFSNKDNSGLILGVVNTLNMLGGAILQKAVGFGLDFQWKGAADDAGIRLYNTQEYINSLSILIGVITICCIASIWLSIGKAKKIKNA